MHRILTLALLSLLIAPSPPAAAAPETGSEIQPTMPVGGVEPPSQGSPTGELEGELLSADPQEALPLTMAKAGDPPAALPDAYFVHAGDTLVVDADHGVLVNDIDPEGDSIQATNYVSTVNGNTSLTTSGSFQYVTSLNSAGIDSFRYRISDGASYSDYATVIIDVLDEANRVPIITADHYSVASGDTLVVPPETGLLHNDFDLDGDDILATNFNQPSNGEASLTTAGNFQYTPDPYFEGTDSFSYRIRDENYAYSSFATVTIEVTEPRNRAPMAQTDWYYTPQATQLAVSATEGVLRNDVDPDGDSFIASNFAAPADGSMSMVTNGSFTFTPDPGFVGTAVASYRLRDERNEYSEFGELRLLVGVYGDIATGVLTPPTPGGFALHEPAPNPFNPRTSLSFRLGEEGPVRLRVYDLRGRTVATVLDRTLEAGEHTVTWDGLDDRGRGVASGSYVVELRSEEKRAVRKVSLVK